MSKNQLANRKPDLLDHLEALRSQRRVAYEDGNTQRVTELNLAIKAFRLENGWSEEDALAEFLEHQRDYSFPYVKPIGNPLIKYDILDETGRPCQLSFTIGQLSKYNTQRDIGSSHLKAVLAVAVA